MGAGRRVFGSGGRTHLFQPKQEAMGFHRSIADAVVAHDPEAAADAMKEIVVEVHEAMCSQLRKGTGCACRRCVNIT